MLSGAGGKDLVGGHGPGIGRGPDGADKLRGGRGNDSGEINYRGFGIGPEGGLEGGPGDDDLNGGKGRDRCEGGAGQNRKRKCEL